MFAFLFGLGLPELLILGVLFLGLVGGGIAILVVVLTRHSGPSETAMLRTENQRLREEIARLKGGQP